MDLDELLDAIIASIFLIIVSLIGIYFPYIVARIFGTHNPHLVLEVASFITYSTSEPGNINAAFLLTNEPVFFYEFRIAPSMPSYFPPNPLYDNNNFFVSIGICYVYDLWQQLAYNAIDSFISAVASYIPGLKAGGTTTLLTALNNVFKSTPSIAKQTLMNFVGTYAFYTAQSAYLQYSYGNSNIWGNILNALQSSAGPALWSTVEFSIMQVADMILQQVMPFPWGFVSGVAFNLAFTSAITLFEYWQATSNPYIGCYYNRFINQGNGNSIFPSGKYTVYQPYLTLSIYYNPNFTFYNGCGDYYLCDPSFTYIYNPNDKTQNNIFKLDLGNINDKGQEVFPEFIILSKVGSESGGPYLNVSILSSRS
jgi:hypothetical protein